MWVRDQLDGVRGVLGSLVRIRCLELCFYWLSTGPLYVQ